jgi:hypothetical protein
MNDNPPLVAHVLLTGSAEENQQSSLG